MMKITCYIKTLDEKYEKKKKPLMQTWYDFKK